MKNIFSVIIFSLCVCTIAVAHVGKQQKAQSVELSFKYTKQAGPGSNQYAVWIENEQGQVVRTLYVTSFTTKGRTRGSEEPVRGYVKRPACVPIWVGRAGANELTDKQLDAFTGATPQSGLQTYVWDMKDDAGKPVPQGTYRINLEATLFNASTIIYTGTFTTGNKPGSIPLTSSITQEDESHSSMISDVNTTVK